MRADEVDDRAIADWCAMWLGARPIEILETGGHLSRVAVIVLIGGRRVVVKIRPDRRRLTACAYVQQHLWHVGFPCPEPLVGPVPFGIDTGLAASAEAYVPGGDMLPPSADGGVDAYARLLARLIRLAPPATDLPLLAPSPPWTAWDHGGVGVWPAADDRPDDLNAISETAWLDDVGRAVQRRLATFGASNVVVGHGDFEAQNIRWYGTQPAALHDWDSVIAAPEAVVVGLAAAVWPAGAGPVATIDETAAFLAAYQRAVGRIWTPDEVGAAWAAGLWVRAFNEKKWRLDGDVALEPEEALERLRRAAVTA